INLLNLLIKKKATFTIQSTVWIDDLDTELIVINNPNNKLHLPTTTSTKIKTHSILVGKNTYYRLANKKKITLFNSSYNITHILGQRGVVNGIFDSSIVVPAKLFLKDQIDF